MTLGQWAEKQESCLSDHTRGTHTQPLLTLIHTHTHTHTHRVESYTCPTGAEVLWFLPSVGSSYVDQQATAAAEIAAAYFAEVRLLPRVGPHVNFQDAVESEIFAAYVARVRLLARVDPRVRVQL